MLSPFENPQDLTLGDLTIQSDEDEVSLHGQASFRKDRESLNSLGILIAALTLVRDRIAAEPNLPQHYENIPATSGPRVKNPFE